MLCLSPFLKIGVTEISFQRDGKEPEEIDLLKRMYKGLAKAHLNSFKKMFGIPSGPRVRFIIRLAKASKILVKGISATLKTPDGFPP